MTKNKCQNCKTRPTRSAHLNSKYCNKCRMHFRRKPKTTMTSAQISEAKELIGKMPREEIAEKIGVSVPSLKRAFRGTRICFHNYCVANPGLVLEVNKFYEKNGNKKTAEHFGIRPKQVEHMVYRYKLAKPRQIRWTDKQITEAARMAGIIDYESQAKFFRRPRAHAGSIKSLWTKKFGIGGGTVNGMSQWIAKEIVKESCPFLKTRFWETRRGNSKTYSRKIYLWVDMKNHIRPGTPKFMRDAINTMADFQCWLHGTSNPRRSIQKLIKERSA